MIVECYTMTLYCRHSTASKGSGPYDGYHSQAREFDGPNRADVRRQARADGWVFSRGDATCPECARQSRTATPRAATGDHPSEARRGHESEGRGGPDAR